MIRIQKDMTPLIFRSRHRSQSSSSAYRSQKSFKFSLAVGMVSSAPYLSIALTIALTIALVASAARAWSKRAPHARRQSQGWCVPEAWMGGRGITEGTVDAYGSYTITRTFGYIRYSATLQKLSMFDIPIASEDKGYLWRIYDYPASILYTMTDDQTCIKEKLPGPFFPMCVPENATATFVNSYYGTDQNSVWAMELAGITTDGANYRVSLSQTTHMPIFEEQWRGFDGQNFFKTISYYNVTIQDVPDAAFRPPDICLNVTVA